LIRPEAVRSPCCHAPRLAFSMTGSFAMSFGVPSDTIRPSSVT
jgi:hypothetical protein